MQTRAGSTRITPGNFFIINTFLDIAVFTYTHGSSLRQLLGGILSSLMQYVTNMRLGIFLPGVLFQNLVYFSKILFIFCVASFRASSTVASPRYILCISLVSTRAIWGHSSIPGLATPYPFSKDVITPV